MSELAESAAGNSPTILQYRDDLSSSVYTVVWRLRDAGPVSAAAIVNELLESHGEYGEGKAKELRVKEDPNSEQRPVMEWLQDVQLHYDQEKVKKLHGRMVILGLSRLDSDLASQLAENGLLKALKREFEPQFEAFLSPLGMKLWSAESPSSPPPHDFQSDRTYLRVDAPAIEDQLGRKPFASALALHLRYTRHEITNSNSSPSLPIEADRQANPVLDDSFLLHLHGPWGSGKSSLLNFLRSELERPLSQEDHPGIDTNEWIVVEFNAWQHQRIDPPWWALMASVYQQTHTRLRDIDKKRAIGLWIREHIWRLGTAAVPHLLAVLIAVLLAIGLMMLFNGEKEFQTTTWLERIQTIDVAIGIVILIAGVAFSISRSLLPGTARAAQTYVELSRNPMSQITQHFDDLVRWVEQPVAVFIDDLDRCEASYVVTLLEGVQTLFRSAPVTYVIAADTRWLRASYENAYQEFSNTVSEPGHPLGHLFTEKIFQLSAPVPDILSAQKDTYWKLLTTRPGAWERQEADMKRWQGEAKQVLRGLSSEQDILAEVQRHRGTEREQVYRAEAVKRLVAPEVQVATEHRLQKYTRLLGSNPRAMKRMVNTYIIQQQLVTLTTELDIKPDSLPLWTILSMRWPSLSEYLSEHPKTVVHIGQSGQTALDGIPEELHDLFRDREVQKVVGGEGAAGTLNEAIIRQCAKLSS